ncbi:MAG: hypothetical protein WCH46_11460, partial [bacterium]
SHAEAMVCAHNHIYRAFQPTGKTWMVISGNGGSLLESTAPPEKRFFGFSLVEVYDDGTVIQKSFGHEFGISYKDSSPIAQYPTTIREKNILTWK